MKPPIIVNDNGDVLVFESVQNAERYLEPYDVRKCNEVFDSEGRRLKQVIVRHGLSKRVKLEPISLPGAATHRLRELLSDFLTRVDVTSEKPLEQWSIEELLLEMLLRFRTE
jgi:hypothetical protein